MDSKIVLDKYRVDAKEMASIGEIADSPLAYKAEEIDSGAKVVIGVVPASSLKTAERKRLAAEATAAMKLRHVNIPVLHDFGVEGDQLIYVTEDLEGTPAEEWVNAEGPMPVGSVLRVASQVVSALGAAALQGINHKAINPRNLLLVPGQTAEGEWPLVKLLHFVGVAPKLAGTDVSVAAFDKSLHYASPEQIQEGTVDFRSELYSLGATMWFLLTGAPPLVASHETTAAAPAGFGVAAEKIEALPKRVRRLLARMLAVNPEERPGDLLAFDRKLQDCLHQVARRESMALRFGIPSFSPNGVTGRRRVPVKALARAALFLASAAMAGLAVSAYLRHGRIVRAEEPIGKPIGVSEASPSVTPVTANTNALASNTAPSTTAAVESDSVQSAPPPTSESPSADAPLSSTDSLASTATGQVEGTPAPPAPSDSPKDLQPPEPAPVMANNPATDSHDIASTKQPEQTPAESPNAEGPAVAQQTAPKETVMHEVRRAQSADDELETRNAPPAPPGKGPESAEPKIASSDSESKVPEKSPAKKTEQAAKPKKQTERKQYSQERISDPGQMRPRYPAGSRRTRLVGVTPEGWWMLQYPSGRIIVVPPRRQYP
jgi:serine/threonine protein kinase